MAAILLIGDRMADRELLSKALAPHGHYVVEISDSEHSSRILADLHPSLVICDVLLPTGSASDLVQRLRHDPAFQSAAFIVHAAAYHEREARVLADECGVAGVLTAPASPETILAAVTSCLGSSTDDPAGSFPGDYGSLRVVSSPLAARAGRLDADKHHLAAILDASLHIAAEQNPAVVLDMLCRQARLLTFAHHAVVGLVGADDALAQAVFSSGLDQQGRTALTLHAIDAPVLRAVVEGRLAVRTGGVDGEPSGTELSSSLTAPITSAGRVHGWLSVRRKLGTTEFTERDEQIVMALAGHAGIAYENTRMFDEQRLRVRRLQDEVRQAISRSSRVLRRVSRGSDTIN